MGMTMLVCCCLPWAVPVFMGQGLLNTKPTFRKWLLTATSCSDFGISKRWQTEIGAPCLHRSDSLTDRAPNSGHVLTLRLLPSLSFPHGYEVQALCLTVQISKKSQGRSFLGSMNNSEPPGAV